MKKLALVLLFGISLSNILNYVLAPVNAVGNLTKTVIGATVDATSSVYNSVTLQS